MLLSFGTGCMLLFPSLIANTQLYVLGWHGDYGMRAVTEFGMAERPRFNRCILRLSLTFRLVVCWWKARESMKLAGVTACSAAVFKGERKWGWEAVIRDCNGDPEACAAGVREGLYMMQLLRMLWLLKLAVQQDMTHVCFK